MIVAVVVLLAVAQVASGKWFHTPTWFQALSNSEKEASALAQCLLLRGGEEPTVPAEGDGKIKGTCIGIDLGTTYR
jgi:hypothetical protein